MGGRIFSKTVSGAITGAVASATGGLGLLTSTGLNTAGDVAAGIVDRVVDGHSSTNALDGKSMVADAITGLASNFTGGLAREQFKKEIVAGSTQAITRA